MSNKNNTPEQKAAWHANKMSGTKTRKMQHRAYIIEGDFVPKPPSRRDLHRADVASRKV